MTRTLPLLLLGLWAVAAPAVFAQAPETACTACHGNPDLFDEDGRALVASFRGGAHAAAGLGCHDCHGGNPDPALAEDLAGSMDDTWTGDPYRGTPSRRDIPSFCGRCHSDIGYMRRYDPQARVDQEHEYRTSQHGLALAAGDEAVATCVDCHGVHGMLSPEEPASPVHPTRVAETCRACHADAALMEGRALPDGRPLPIDQFAKWRQSVHAEALLEREDLAAPTCNDCHGNHGAVPPGVHSVSFVCGQCHGREAEVFRASGKWRAFEAHNELLAEAGTEGCSACHDPVPAGAAGVKEFSECASCHGNHAVVRPTIAMLSPLPETPCAICHGELGATSVREPEALRERQRETEAALVEAARADGLSGDALFDQLVDAALSLPHHAAPGEAGLVLKPEFERLFRKFRIGKTHFSYPHPVTGETVRGEIVRCGGCHSTESAGQQVAGTLLAQMSDLTVRTARAERILLAARRGGVETREASLSVDLAVDSQIELQVLLHGFAPGEESAFEETRREGLERARAALQAGEAAIGELAFRRLGLAVALIFVVLVLVGLALKIRELPP